MTTTTAITKRIFVDEKVDHLFDYLQFYTDEFEDAIILIEKVCVSEMEKANLFLLTKTDEDGNLYTIKEWKGHSAQVRAFSEEYYVVENGTFKEGTIKYKRPEEPYRTLMVMSSNKKR